MSQLGISNDVINECGNHIKQGMSGIYIQDRRVPEQAKHLMRWGNGWLVWRVGAGLCSKLIKKQPLRSQCPVFTGVASDRQKVVDHKNGQKIQK